jgi:hypothetical protein
MIRRVLSVASLMAILGSLAAPAAAACPISGTTPHGCCSEPVASRASELPSSSCCAESETTATADRATPPVSGGGCDCIHAPSAPPAQLVGTPTSSDVQPGPAVAAAPLPADLPTEIGAGPSDPAASGGRHPPIFLLACSFLT